MHGWPTGQYESSCYYSTAHRIDGCGVDVAGLVSSSLVAGSAATYFGTSTSGRFVCTGHAYVMAGNPSNVGRPVSAMQTTPIHDTARPF